MEQEDVGATFALLREALPIDREDETLLLALAAAARAESYPVGTTILQQGGEPSSHLYVIRAGHVEIRVDGQLVDMPGVGKIFGELSMVAGSAPTATVRASEEVECLLLDRASATSVLGTQEGVSFVQASLRRGLSQALDTDGYSLIKAIEQADSETAAIAAARELPSGVCALVAAGSDATKVGRVVGSSIDALTRRLLGSRSPTSAMLRQRGHGWLWGVKRVWNKPCIPTRTTPSPTIPAISPRRSSIRTSRSSPNASRLGSSPRGSRVAKVMRWPCTPDSDGLSTHGPMHSEPGCQNPSLDGSILSSIAFDFRRVHGPLDVEPALHAVVGTASRAYPQFLRHLTHRALDRKPPTGFMRNLVVESKGEHAGRLDIKRGGVAIIANVARAYAIADGRPEKGTIDRLRAAEATGRLDADRRVALEEAFRLLWQTDSSIRYARSRAARRRTIRQPGASGADRAPRAEGSVPDRRR